MNIRTPFCGFQRTGGSVSTACNRVFIKIGRLSRSNIVDLFDEWVTGLDINLVNISTKL